MNMSIQLKVIYSKDDLKKLNTYVLRTIPSEEKYSSLRQFLNDENRSNLSNIIKRPMVPAYLKDKYGDKPNNGVMISRGNCRDQRDHHVSRRKLYVQKGETTADKINEELREILTKLSDNNKGKLFADFQ